MEKRNWIFSEADKTVVAPFWEKIPDKIIDVHSHIYRLKDLGRQFTPYTDGPEIVGIQEWQQQMQYFLGDGKLLSAYHTAPPCETKAHIEASNHFVMQELESHPESKGFVLIAPDTGRDRVEQYLKNTQITGLKPFSYYADYVGPKSEAPLGSFLPEWAWECAHDHGLVILAHLMRKDSLADPLNHLEIRKMCTRYPNARLMLDHCGRGFNSNTIIRGIEFVKDLPNVYFDTSSICEVIPMITVMKGAGLDRVVYGSDFPLTQVRGKSITVGNGFIWLNNHNVDWESYRELCEPVLLGCENIRSLFQSISLLSLSQEDIKDLFYYNAVRMIEKR